MFLYTHIYMLGCEYYFQQLAHIKENIIHTLHDFFNTMLELLCTSSQHFNISDVLYV